MNLQRFVLTFIGAFFGGVCIFLVHFANAQEAYRYNFAQKFTITNQILFGGVAYKNISLLYAYEPSSLEGLALLNTSDVKILRQRERNSWWLEPSYEVTGYDGNDLSALSAEEAYLAVEEAYENIEYFGLFVIEQGDDQISTNTTSDDGNGAVESSSQ